MDSKLTRPVTYQVALAESGKHISILADLVAECLLAARSIWEQILQKLSLEFLRAEVGLLSA